MHGNRLVSLIVATGFAAASSLAMAQNTGAPARETPRPQDIDPAVNTSATPPARETPRPQDVEPRVNTSAPSQTPPASSGAANGPTSGAVPGAAAPGATPSSAQPSASGARASRATGATGATGAPGAAAPAAGNADAAANAAGTKTPSKGKALDRLELDTTQITGNRELPKVLYIVPWKRSDLGDLVGKPVNSLLDEVLTPVDRDVFQRENRYYRALTPGAAENDALSAPDGRSAPVREPVATSNAPAAGSKGSATYPVPTGSGSAAPAPRDEK